MVESLIMIENTYSYYQIRKIIAENKVTLKDFNEILEDIREEDKKIASYIRWQKKVKTENRRIF